MFGTYSNVGHFFFSPLYPTDALIEERQKYVSLQMEHEQMLADIGDIWTHTGGAKVSMPPAGDHKRHLIAVC